LDRGATLPGASTPPGIYPSKGAWIRTILHPTKLAAYPCAGFLV